MRLGKDPLPDGYAYPSIGDMVLPSYERPPEITYVCPECGEDAVGYFGIQKHQMRHSGAPDWHPMHNGPAAVACIEAAMRTWERK